MYKLRKETITKIKHANRVCYHNCDPFEFDEVNNPPKKPRKFKSYAGYKEGNTIYYQSNQNLLFEVGKELKPKTYYKQGLEEEGLSITPVAEINNVEHSYGVYEEIHSLTEKLIDLLADKYFDLIEKDKQVNLLYNYLNAMNDKFDNIILSDEFGAYELSGLWCYVLEIQNKPFVKKMENADVSNEVGKYINEVRGTLNQVNDNYQLININQINFLNLCEKNKKELYNITINKIEKENFKMKTVNGKNKSERMINKPLKYMGLVVTDSSSNKHLYAEVESGDFNKYAYFIVYEEPVKFNQTLANGRIINKYCFHLDNFDDGKGHDAIFVPSGMTLELVNGDVTDKVGYLVAFERNQGNNQIIEQLNGLDAGADSIKALNAKTLPGLKYHY